MLATNVMIDVASAACLPRCARAPEPSSSTTIAPATGSQITLLSSGQWFIAFLASSCLEDEPADEHCETDDHRKRVMIEIARLQATRDVSHEAHGLCAAVHDRAVDQRLVADLPEDPAEQPPAPCEDVLVEPVEVVLVREHAIEPRELLLPARGQVGPLEIEEPRRHERRQRQIDRGPLDGVEHELRRPVEVFAGL